MAKKLPKGLGKKLIAKYCPKPKKKPPTKKPPTKKPPKKNQPTTKSQPPKQTVQILVDRFRRWGPRDVNQINEMMEKDKEFEDMYKLVMDSFDDTCYHDFPQEYKLFVRPCITMVERL